MNEPLPARVVMTRLIDYIELSGLDISDALLFQLAAVVREGAESGHADLFGWSLAQLDGRIPNVSQPPSPSPPIHRGSIGYGRRQ